VDEWDVGEDAPLYLDPKKQIKFSDYKYCVTKGNDPESNKNLNARKIAQGELGFRRTYFLLTEIVNDLGIKKAPWYAQLYTFCLAIFLLYFRMFIHYVGQYLILKFIDAPVTGMYFDYYKVHLEYSTWNVYMEMMVVASGPLSNSLLFMFFMFVCYVSQKCIYCFPVQFCKVIAWYGLMTIMDFVFIVIVDQAYQDKDGDLWKLYNYYMQAESSGLIGMFITFLIQFGILIWNCWIMYQYTVFIHCDGRIKDIYLRISGLGKGYYLPDDNEVSWAYLRQTYFLGEINNNRIVVNPLKVPKLYSYKQLTSKAYQF